MTVTEEQQTDVLPPGQRISSKPFRRLLLGQTAFDFWGRRWLGFGASLLLVAISVLSLGVRELNLGIDFEGGVAYDVPASDVTTDQLRTALDDNGVESANARVEERSSSSGDIIKIQIADQDQETRVAIQESFAEAAGVQPSDVSVASVSSTWGDQITKKAVTALIVFLVLLAIVIAIRYEWRMAVAAIVAMLHDVVVSAGIYSIFGFEVTPPTVIAFLTILGYSLYDTIVVFDRVRENQRRITSAGLTTGDLVNVSTNQVLLRSLNTSISAVLPVISLLVIGTGLLGQLTLAEFAIALLVGMITGAYSSIFIATPLLGVLKHGRSQDTDRGHLVDEDLRTVVVRGVGILAPLTGRRRGAIADRGRASRKSGPGTIDDVVAGGESTGGRTTAVAEATTEQLLSHPARPRKKKRN